MSAASITFTPEAQDYIASFRDASGASLGLYLAWGTTVTSRDGRVVLHDTDWSISISKDVPSENSVAVRVGDFTAYIRRSSFEELAGRTVYLSHGHSSDTSVTCGDLLKIS